VTDDDDIAPGEPVRPAFSNPIREAVEKAEPFDPDACGDVRHDDHDHDDGEADSGPRRTRKRGEKFSVRRMNESYALVLMGSKAVVVREQKDGPIEDRLKVLSIESFRAWYANRFTTIRDKEGKEKVVTWATAWLCSRERRQYKGIEFFPNPDGAKSTEGYLNLWRGFAVEARPKVNGWATYRDHLFTNVCHQNQALFDWVLGWFAHIVQRPRERLGTALVLRGKMGTGKTKVGEIMGSLWPAHYYMVDDPRYITGQFNPHMASCILLQAEEAVWAGDKAAEGRLKGLVTSIFQMIEAKGIDPIRLDNHVRLIMTSNEDWVVPAGKDERRFAVLDVGDGCAQNWEYFAAIDAEMADGGREALLHDLLHFDLSKVNLRQIPLTAPLLEQKIRSLTPIESWWMAGLERGAPSRKWTLWPEVVRCDELFDDYVATSDKIGVKRRAEETVFGMQLKKIVPGLTKKRVSSEDGGRPWAYVLPPLEACRAFLDEQLQQAVPWEQSGP
jgi:hypothetical protein